MAGSLQDIRSFTVMIRDPQSNKSAGTGFIVYSNGKLVKIVTAAHVITEIHNVSHPKGAIGKPIGIYFHQIREFSGLQRNRLAHVSAYLDEYDDDVVLLELEGPDPRPTFSQNQAIVGPAEESRHNPYVSYGFPDIGAYPESITDGTIIDLVASKTPGIYQYDAVQLQASSVGLKIRKGMSGAAVLDKYRNLVIGIVTEFWSPSSSGVAWAEDCKVLLFGPFGLESATLPAEIATPLIPGVAFDRSTYRKIEQPGLRLIHMPDHLDNWVGREQLIHKINQYWLNSECKLMELVGFGGQGKSSLANKWLELFLSNKKLSKPDGIIWWDFYYNKDLDSFTSDLLTFLSDRTESLLEQTSVLARIDEIKNRLMEKSYLLIFDGFEVMQYQTGDLYGELKDNDLRQLMEFLGSENHKSFCIVTTRVPLVELVNKIYYQHQQIEDLSIDEGVALLRKNGVKGDTHHLEKIVREWAGHPLTLTLLGAYISRRFGGVIDDLHLPPTPEIDEPQYERVHKLLVRYDQFLSIEERRFLQILSAFRSMVDTNILLDVFRNPENELTILLAKLSKSKFSRLVQELVKMGLIREADPTHRMTRKKRKQLTRSYVIHPLIKNYFYETLDNKLRFEINMMLKDYVQKAKIPLRPKSIEQMHPAFDEVYYLCEANLYEEAYSVYQNKICKVDLIAIDETGYLTTVLSGYQADLELLRLFFPNGDFNNIPDWNNPKALADILILAGADLDVLGNAEIANRLYKRSALLGIKSGELNYATWAYQNEGTSLTTIGKLTEGLEVLKTALKYAKKSEGWIREGTSTFVKIAWIEFLRGKIGTVEKWINRAKILFATDKSGMVQSYEHSMEGAMVAEILVRTGRYEEALEISNRNMEFLIGESWRDDVGCNRVLGMISEAKNDYKNAKRYYNKAVKLIEKTGMREETIFALHRRGNLMITMKNLKQADKDLRRALELAVSCKYLWEVDVRNSIARLAMANGKSTLNYKELLKDLLAIKSKATETGYKWALGDSLVLLGELEIENVHRANAIKYLNQAVKLQRRMKDPKSKITQKKIKEIKKRKK